MQTAGLTSLTLDKASQLCLPSVKPPSSENNNLIQTQVQEIYDFCMKNRMQARGSLFLALRIDLSARNVHITDGENNIRQVRQIKTTSYTEDGRCILLKHDFYMGEETNPVSFRVPRSSDLLTSTFFNGMEYERIFSTDNDFPSVPERFWDQWEEHIPQEIKHYDNTVYPKIIGTIAKIHSLACQATNQLDLLDLGGGSGRLAARVLNELPEQVGNITVLDRSAALIENAKARAKKFPGHMTANCLDLNNENALKASELKNSADVIVLCGVVAQQVLSKQKAKKVMEACLPILRNNGFVIAASLSPGLFCKEEFEKMGYKVFNQSHSFMIDRGPTQPPHATNEFYILQKT